MTAHSSVVTKLTQRACTRSPSRRPVRLAAVLTGVLGCAAPEAELMPGRDVEITLVNARGERTELRVQTGTRAHRLDVQARIVGDRSPSRWLRIVARDAVGGAAEARLEERAGMYVGSLDLEGLRGPAEAWVAGPLQAIAPAGSPRADIWSGVLGSAPFPLPELLVPHAAPPNLDGRLIDGTWHGPGVEFTASLGGAAPEGRSTRAWLSWDETHLYVGFEAEDPHVTDRYRRRDDPLYEHEVVELFLMPRRSVIPDGPYIELQADPDGTRFDARFVASRKGMDLGFNPRWVATSTRSATGWSSEWAIPWTEIGAHPEAGSVWRGNLFRIDRSKGMKDAYQAWSPPMVGDFHRTERFGFLRFGPEPTAANAGQPKSPPAL